MNHDDDTVQFALPSREARDRMFAELDPYAVVDDHTTEITAIVPPGTSAARPAQVVKTVMHLAGMVDVWEADGELHRLDAYLARRIPGEPHPLNWARQYRHFNDAIGHAATMLRHGGAA